MALLLSLTLLHATPPASAHPHASNSVRLTEIGDSWFSGVGATTRCYPRLTMDASSCDGRSISDDLARDLGVSAYQNLGLGGAMIIDALTDEAPKVDPRANVIVINIGFNDEKPIGDGHDLWVAWSRCAKDARTYFPATTGTASCTYREPWTGSMYNPQGFAETPDEIAARYQSLVSAVRKRAPSARLYVVIPAHIGQVPWLPWNPTQITSYQWASEIIASIVRATPNATVIDLGDAAIYEPTNFVPRGSCPTPDISECAGHPNDAGASVIASFIARQITSPGLAQGEGSALHALR